MTSRAHVRGQRLFDRHPISFLSSDVVRREHHNGILRKLFERVEHLADDRIGFHRGRSFSGCGAADTGRGAANKGDFLVGRKRSDFSRYATMALLPLSPSSTWPIVAISTNPKEPFQMTHCSLSVMPRAFVHEPATRVT